jgi:hypothetical protein
MKTIRILTIILVGLWLSACSHTAPPAESRPEKEKTAESRSTPPTATESKPQETSEQSQPSQTADQKAAGKEQKETGKTETDGQSAPSDTSGSKQQEAGQQSKTDPTATLDAAENQQPAPKDVAGPGRAASADTVDAKLAEARKNLRISEETEKRIASELEQLKKSGSASPEAVGDYEAYLKSVQAMTAENREILERMKNSYSGRSSDESASSAPDSGKPNPMPASSTPEEQTLDEVAALDRQLNASLNEFDEKLLREMDEIRAESAEKMQDLARDAAEAAKRLREKGLDAGSSESASTGQADDQEQISESGQDPGSSKDTAGSETASGSGVGKTDQGSARDEKRKAGYEDDDIVARQLREAAENETDPALKEKLWKEYEAYKKGL